MAAALSFLEDRDEDTDLWRRLGVGTRFWAVDWLQFGLRSQEQWIDLAVVSLLRAARRHLRATERRLRLRIVHDLRSRHQCQQGTSAHERPANKDNRSKGTGQAAAIPQSALTTAALAPVRLARIAPLPGTTGGMAQIRQPIAGDGGSIGNDALDEGRQREGGFVHRGDAGEDSIPRDGKRSGKQPTALCLFAIIL